MIGIGYREVQGKTIGIRAIDDFRERSLRTGLYVRISKGLNFDGDLHVRGEKVEQETRGCQQTGARNKKREMGIFR